MHTQYRLLTFLYYFHVLYQIPQQQYAAKVTNHNISAIVRKEIVILMVSPTGLNIK